MSNVARYTLSVYGEAMENRSPADRVAANIRAELARQGWTQARLAEALQMSQQNLSRRLSGRVSFTLDEAYTAADALGVPASQIFPTAASAA